MEKKFRLLVDVTQDIHKQIKIRAAIRNITMKDYIEKAVLEFIRREEKYDKGE